MIKSEKLKIKLSDIVKPSISEQFRVGGTDQEQVNRLVVHMAKHGQLNGIEVKKEGPNLYKIVVGNHRFNAAEVLGWTHIDAHIVSFSSQKEEEDYQFDENEAHTPSKGNTKAELEKLIRRHLFVHKTFGPTPSLNDLNAVVKWAKGRTSSFPTNTIRSIAKKLLAQQSTTTHSRGTLSYIKSTPQLTNAIKTAMDNTWDGNSIKSSSKGWIVQCISQDSDATIKPGTSLVQKYNTGAKSCGVFYVGTVEGLSDAKIDEYRIKWLDREMSFSNHIEKASNNNLKPFDRRVILPQKDSEIRAGVKRLEYQNGKLIPII